MRKLNRGKALQEVLVGVLVFCALLISSAMPVMAATVVNGDFESEGGWTTDIYDANTGGLMADMKNESDPSPYEGSYCAIVGQKTEGYSPTWGSYHEYYAYMRQTVDLPSGASELFYNVWSYRTGTPVLGVRIKDLDDNTLAEEPVPYGRKSEASWASKTIDVSEFAEDTVLIEIYFEDFGSYAGCWGRSGAIAVDNFSVSAVPIPGAIWLLGSGLLGLIGIRRRNS